MLLFTISYLPRYGVENPESILVVKRYVENGLQETGAVNIISGIILDYRAFDTLGESHVLFTALMCVTVLLRRDSKNMRTQYEDFYTIRDEKYHELYRESIMKFVAAVLLPCLLLYGAYVLLNGQISLPPSLWSLCAAERADLARRRFLRRRGTGVRPDHLRGRVWIQEH